MDEDSNPDGDLIKAEKSPGIKTIPFAQIHHHRHSFTQTLQFNQPLTMTDVSKQDPLPAEVEKPGLEADVKADESHEVHTDIGLDYYRQSLLMEPDHREEVAKRVLKKIDFVFLPAVSSIPPILFFCSDFCRCAWSISCPSSTSKRSTMPPPMVFERT